MRKFGPKGKDHPSVGQKCMACGEELKEGDFTVLVALGPGKDKGAREACEEGRPYNSVAIEIHWECSGTGVSQNDKRKV